jgi:hypothetical protein
MRSFDDNSVGLSLVLRGCQGFSYFNAQGGLCCLAACAFCFGGDLEWLALEGCDLVLRVDLVAKPVESAVTAVVLVEREDEAAGGSGYAAWLLRGERDDSSVALQLLHSKGDPQVMTTLWTGLRLHGFVLCQGCVASLARADQQFRCSAVWNHAGIASAAAGPRADVGLERSAADGAIGAYTTNARKRRCAGRYRRAADAQRLKTSAIKLDTQQPFLFCAGNWNPHKLVTEGDFHSRATAACGCVRERVDCERVVAICCRRNDKLRWKDARLKLRLFGNFAPVGGADNVKRGYARDHLRVSQDTQYNVAAPRWPRWIGTCGGT